MKPLNLVLPTFFVVFSQLSGNHPISNNSLKSSQYLFSSQFIYTLLWQERLYSIYCTKTSKSTHILFYFGKKWQIELSCFWFAKKFCFCWQARSRFLKWTSEGVQGRTFGPSRGQRPSASPEGASRRRGSGGVTPGKFLTFKVTWDAF